MAKLILNLFDGLPLKNTAAYLDVSELIEVNKSVIGRGIVGTVFFGPAGTILGGLSGIGKKDKKDTHHVNILSFLSANGEVKNITFRLSFLTKDVARKFDNDLKKKMLSVQRSDMALEILHKKEISEFIL